MPDSSSLTAWQPERPHDNLPLLPPSADLESKLVLKTCIEARAALAGLSKAADLIPNPTMLVGTLPLLEARASSEIENIVTTADKLFEYLRAEGTADPATKEALRYRHALLEGFRSLETKPLTTSTAEAVCSRIKGIEMHVRRVPGTALANQGTGEVIYTPPVGETRLRNLLGNWEKFLHAKDSIDPLVKMATAHYQFEAIHPFTDGNGRTGRILNILFLADSRLLTLPILYLSRYIIERRSEYYGRLLAVTRDQAWEPWIVFMLQGVTDTAQWTTSKIAAIRELAARTRIHIRAALPKIYSQELVDLLFEQPYCRIANLIEAGIAKRQTASTYLSRLVEAGLLEARVSGREKLFIHTRLLRLLTEDSNDFVPFGDE